MPDADKYEGLLMHSANFRSNDDRLRGKRVVVVGNSYSGVEISANLVGHCQSVTNVFKRPYLVFPRLLNFQVERNMFKIIPIDLLFSRDLTYSNRTPEQQRLFKMALYRYNPIDFFKKKLYCHFFLQVFMIKNESLSRS